MVELQLVVNKNVFFFFLALADSSQSTFPFSQTLVCYASVWSEATSGSYQTRKTLSSSCWKTLESINCCWFWLIQKRCFEPKKHFDFSETSKITMTLQNFQETCRKDLCSRVKLGISNWYSTVFYLFLSNFCLSSSWFGSKLKWALMKLFKSNLPSRGWRWQSCWSLTSGGIHVLRFLPRGTSAWWCSVSKYVPSRQRGRRVLTSSLHGIWTMLEDY